jgi:hypothetical protein
MKTWAGAANSTALCQQRARWVSTEKRATDLLAVTNWSMLA